jgi:hypothetical protein
VELAAIGIGTPDAYGFADNVNIHCTHDLS